MGCDNAVLISHQAFAGSDTHATSYVVSKAIQKLAPFDLVLAGERATDGDTAQVGPGIAAFLRLPLSTYTSRIIAIEGDRITVERLVDTGYEGLKLPVPCLLTVVKEISFPRLPTLRGKQRARTVEIPVWGPEDIDVEEKFLGLKGSPTRVTKITKPKIIRKGKIVKVDEDGIALAARELADFLEEKNLL